MDVIGLKQYIVSNPDNIEYLLDSAGFYKIKKNKTEFRCAHDENSNPTSIKVNIDNLKSNDFARNINGDIITLLQEQLDMTFPQILKWIGEKLDIDIGDNKRCREDELKSPFGGFFISICINKNEEKVNRILNENKLITMNIIQARSF